MSYQHVSQKIKTKECEARFKGVVHSLDRMIMHLALLKQIKIIREGKPRVRFSVKNPHHVEIRIRYTEQILK